MNNVARNENEKTEKVKKTSEAESYEDYENEEMENSAEGSQMGEASLGDTDLPSSTFQTESSIANVELESSIEEESLKDSEEERKKNILREKWLSVTGRKPRNFPTLKKFRIDQHEYNKLIFFGDRRPVEVEKKRRKKWLYMIEKEKLKKPMINYGKVIREWLIPGPSQGLTCVRFEQGGEFLATSYRNGGVQVRKRLTGEKVATLESREMSEGLSIRGLRFHPIESHKIYIGGAIGAVQVFDVETAKLVGNSMEVAQLNNLDINSNGSILVTGGRDGIVCVYDAYTLELISKKSRPNINNETDFSIDEEFHRLRVYALKCHPKDPNMFATGGWDRTVKVWDVRMPGAVLSFTGPLLNGDAIDIDEDKMVTAAWCREDSIKIWNFYSGQLFQKVDLKNKATIFEGEFLYIAKFFKEDRHSPQPSTHIVVGGSGFTEVDVIDITNSTLVASLPSYKSVLALDTCSDLIAYGGKESLFRIGKVNLPKNGVFTTYK